MSSGLFGVGLTGLRAAQLGLMTTEHNISNASTPGYSRQRIVQSTNSPVLTGAGFVGQGTSVSTIERLYSQTLVKQMNVAQTNVGELDKYYAQIKQIDNMLADPNSGLSPALQDFFRGIQAVSANPSSLSSRQAMISSAQSLVVRFQSMETRMNELYEGVGNEITTTVDTINSYAQQVAELNQRIILAQASGSLPANDLLDQRDQLISELNELVEVSARVDSDGSYSVFYGNGQQLVIGNQVAKLVAKASAEDLTRIVVAVDTPSGAKELPESLITGGSLAGLLEFRSETLDRATNDIGRVAATMALTLNAQHALGQDLLGQVSGDAGFEDDFFTLGSLKTTGNTLNTGSAALSLDFIAPPPNNGSNFYTDLTGNDYRLTFGAAGAYTITDLADNSTVLTVAAPGTGTQQFDGLTLTITTAGASGDSFLLQPTIDAARNIAVNNAIASDPRLIAAAAPVRTESPSTNSGSAAIGSSAVSTGYALTNLPLSLSYSSSAGGTLENFPTGTVTVTAAGTTTSYTIAAPTDTVPYTSGATISFDGISFSISGTPINGDQFTIAPNLSGTSDSRNTLAIGKLQTQNTVAGGSATYQSAYARLVNDIGNKTREIQVTGEAQSALLKQSKDARDSLSGVNLDEEAANLLRYQQAYQASAKALDIGSKLFDVILALRS